MKRTATEWAQMLVDHVSTVTQIREESLTNVEDWRRNAEKLFQQAMDETVRSTVNAMTKRKSS